MNNLENFGFHPFKKDKYFLPKKSFFFNEELIEGEKNFNIISDSIKEGSPFYVITGFRPDTKIHLGYKFLTEILNYFSDKKKIIYLINPITEKFLMEKPIHPECSILSTPFYNLLKNKSQIRIRDDNSGGLDKFVLKISSEFNANHILKRFDIHPEDSISKVWGLIYSSASYFIPNRENDTKYPTLFLGNKSHADSILFANEIAKKEKLFPISSLFIKHIPGKDGSEKMSASKADTSIYLGDNLIQEFIQTKTGETYSKCPAFQIAKYFVMTKPIKEVKVKCIKKKNCGECKEKMLKGILRK